MGVYYICLIMAQLMVGLSIVVSKQLILSIPVAIILALRFTAATVLLFVTQGVKVALVGRNQARDSFASITWRQKAIIAAQGLCAGGLFNLFLLLGLNYTTASIAGIITSVLPAIIVILSVLFLRERLSFLTILCVIFSVCGLLIINLQNFHGGSNSTLLGELLVFIALLPEATYYVLTKRYPSNLPIFFLSALMNLVNLPFMWAVLLYQYPRFFPYLTMHDLALIVLLGLTTALFYVFWYIGSKRVSGTSAGLFTAIMPIGTLLIAWAFLGETLTLIQGLGMILIVTAIITNAISR